MRTVYSVELFRAEWSVAGTPQDLWTVPTGFVDVLRCIDGYSDSSSAGSLFLEDATGAFMSIVTPVEFAPVTWRGRQVFVAGTTVRGQVTAATIFARGCGYRLAA